MYTWRQANARANSQRKVWSKGENGQRDWRETQWSSFASRENIDQASPSHPPKPILRKVRLFCSVRGLLTKYSGLNEILS